MLRDLQASDAEAMFAMDSRPDVHRYLGNTPVVAMAQIDAAIAHIQEQYRDHGIGRWAVVLQATGQWIGWAGLKFVTEPMNGHVNYYDLGYRLHPDFWGMGYATEAGVALLEYGFQHLETTRIHAIVDLRNVGSRRVLSKLGFQSGTPFLEDGAAHDWCTLTRAAWRSSVAL